MATFRRSALAAALAAATFGLSASADDGKPDNESQFASAASGAGHESLVEGVRMTAGLFRTRLKALGIEPVAALDQPFDPNVSQAVGTVDVADSALDGVVVDELQRGYKMGDQLLRPSQVRVGRFGQERT